MPLDAHNPLIRDKLKRLEALRARGTSRRRRRSPEIVKRAAAVSDAVVAARTNFPAFFEYVMRDERSGQRIVLEPVHESWIEFIFWCWRNGLYPLILAPWGHGKTTIMVALQLWILGVDNCMRTKLFTAQSEEAQERLQLVREYIEQSDEYHQVFPHVREARMQKWTQERLYLERPTRSKDASLQALGITGGGIGGRADFICFDDIADAKNMLTEPRRRDKVWQTFSVMAMSRLEETDSGDGELLLKIGTRWHAQDPTGRILADPEMRSQWGVMIQKIADDYQSIEVIYLIGSEARPKGRGDTPVRRYVDAHPCRFLDNVRAPRGTDADAIAIHKLEGVSQPELGQIRKRRLPLWSRYPQERLRKKRRSVGARDYARGFQQRPVSESDIVFKPELIAAAKDPKHIVVDSLTRNSPWWRCFRVIGYDLIHSDTFSDNTESFFVAFVLAVDRNHHRWPLWIERHRSIGYDAQINLILQLNDRFKPDVHMVENNGAQKWVVQHTRKRRLIVKPYTTTAVSKRDLQYGIPALATEYEQELWHIPYGDARSRRIMEPFLDELGVWPLPGYFNDCVMASWFAREGVPNIAMAEPEVYEL